MGLIIGKKHDHAFSVAAGTALLRDDGTFPDADDVLIVFAGTLPTAEAVFVGIPAPEHAYVNLQSPDPIEGEPERWLYGPTSASYTVALAAVKVP